MTATTWKLQDAKARFSELVRRARSEGPQHVTVHGREEVVVISAEEFRKVSGKLPVEGRNTGQALIEALKYPRFAGLNLDRERVYSPVRDTPDFNDPEFDR